MARHLVYPPGDDGDSNSSSSSSSEDEKEELLPKSSSPAGCSGRKLCYPQNLGEALEKARLGDAAKDAIYADIARNRWSKSEESFTSEADIELPLEYLLGFAEVNGDYKGSRELNGFLASNMKLLVYTGLMIPVLALPNIVLRMTLDKETAWPSFSHHVISHLLSSTRNSVEIAMVLDETVPEEDMTVITTALRIAEAANKSLEHHRTVIVIPFLRASRKTTAGQTQRTLVLRLEQAHKVHPRVLMREQNPVVFIDDDSSTPSVYLEDESEHVWSPPSEGSKLVFKSPLRLSNSLKDMKLSNVTTVLDVSCLPWSCHELIKTAVESMNSLRDVFLPRYYFTQPRQPVMDVISACSSKQLGSVHYIVDLSLPPSSSSVVIVDSLDAAIVTVSLLSARISRLELEIRSPTDDFTGAVIDAIRCSEPQSSAVHLKLTSFRGCLKLATALSSRIVALELSRMLASPDVSAFLEWQMLIFVVLHEKCPSLECLALEWSCINPIGPDKMLGIKPLSSLRLRRLYLAQPSCFLVQALEVVTSVIVADEIRLRFDYVQLEDLSHLFTTTFGDDDDETKTSVHLELLALGAPDSDTLRSDSPPAAESMSEFGPWACSNLTRLTLADFPTSVLDCLGHFPTFDRLRRIDLVGMRGPASDVQKWLSRVIFGRVKEKAQAPTVKARQLSATPEDVRCLLAMGVVYE